MDRARSAGYVDLGVVLERRDVLHALREARRQQVPEQLPRMPVAQVRKERRLVATRRLARRRQTLVVTVDEHGDAELRAHRLCETDVVGVPVREEDGCNVGRPAAEEREAAV